MANETVGEELLDYVEDDQETTEQNGDADQATAVQEKKDVKGNYVSIHSSGFRDFLLRPELLRAIVDCGFEHPSEGLFGGFIVIDPFQRDYPHGLASVRQWSSG